MGIQVEKLKEWAPWIYRGVVLLLILGLAWFWNAEHREKVQLRNENESLKLKAQGFADDQEKKQRDLDKMAKELLAKDAQWKGQVEELRRLLGENPKVIRVVEIRTKPEPVYLPSSEPARQCPTDGKKIVVVEGDQLHAELKEIDWGTKNNNNVMTGRIMCFRDTPTPIVLHSQLISEKQPAQADVFVPPVEQPYRWGAGWFVSATKGGWATGPKVLFPPFDANLLLFKTRLEADAGFGIGGGGERVLQLSVGTRWK